MSTSFSLLFLGVVLLPLLGALSFFFVAGVFGAFLFAGVLAGVLAGVFDDFLVDFGAGFVRGGGREFVEERVLRSWDRRDCLVDIVCVLRVVVFTCEGAV